MREVLALIVTVIVAYVVYALFFAGGGGGEHESGPPQAETVFPVTLDIAIGGTRSVVAGGSTYRLGVSAVSDSRCPGCPDPGRTTIVVTTQRVGTKKETFRLASDAAEDLVTGAIALRVAGVKPDAVAGQTIGKKEYVVSLEVDYAPGMKAPAVADSVAAATP